MARYIVLVDDEDGILKALKRELAGWAREREVELRIFSSGEDALSFLVEEHLDVILVVSDQRMPGIKGHEFLAMCNQRYPEIILLLLTGYTDIQDITRAIRIGISSFILKPWEHDDLIYELTKAYNIYEARDRNRRYLQLIKNELSLAALLRGEVSREGDFHYNRCQAGGKQRVSREQTLRGVDVMQHVAIGNNELLIFAAHLESDGVRGSMIGGAILLRLFSTALACEPGTESDMAAMYTALTEILATVSREVPEIMIRYTLAILNQDDLTMKYTGNGYAPWIVVRDEGFGEIETDPGHPGHFKTSKVHPGDLIAIASPGFLDALQDPEEPRALRILARRISEIEQTEQTEQTESLETLAEELLAGTEYPDPPTDQTVMLLRINHGE